MEYYITAMRAAASHCEPYELKPIFDCLVERAREDYQAGALDIVEYGDIVNEYADTLRNTNAVNYA